MTIEHTFGALLLSEEDGVATLLINRPNEFNAIDASFVQDFVAAADEINRSKTIRAVVFSGAGKYFCVGANVRELPDQMQEPPPQAYTHVQYFHQIVRSLVQIDKPVIAAIRGMAVGAGCNLALAADIIFAAEGTKFSQIFTQLGLVPDSGGTYFLPRSVGPAKAKELMFLHTMLDAADAERLGMINYVVPDDRLMHEAHAFAHTLAKGPTQAYGAIKHMVNASLGHTLEQCLEDEARWQASCFSTDDASEGTTAFIEKRPAVFTGM